MQKSKPIEYLQSILYHIQLYWKEIVTALLVLITIILALLWSCTQEDIYYYIGAGTSITAVLIECVIAEPYITEVLEILGLWDTPEDETERSIDNAE